MTYPNEYDSQVAIPLPSDEKIRAVVGDSYDPEKTCPNSL